MTKTQRVARIKAVAMALEAIFIETLRRKPTLLDSHTYMCVATKEGALAGYWQFPNCQDHDSAISKARACFRLKADEDNTVEYAVVGACNYDDCDCGGRVRVRTFVL